jgi:hypothetical protein
MTTPSPTTSEPAHPPGNRHRHLITDRASLTVCTRCAAPIIRGHAEGLLATADPTPLTRHAELTLLAAGRHTYALHHGGELVHRNRYRLHREVHPVLPEHRCGQPVEPAGLDPWPPVPADPDQPPF